MTNKMRKDLIAAGELIASRKRIGICEAMNTISGNDFEWQQTEEAKMIAPNYITWWGLSTMDNPYYSSECMGARLIGIAMMVTMPKEILEGKCC